MKYYLVSPFANSPLLTYSSVIPLQKGEFVEIEIKKSLKKGVVWEEVDQPKYKCKEAKSLGFFLLPHQVDLASFIAQYYCSSLGKALMLFSPYQTLSSDLCSSALFTNAFKLSVHQQEALNFISQKPFSLLFGETGSGKSEVYIHLIIQAIQGGKNALLLMPEISLTPQMQQRLERVFGICVGVWHSKMSKAKKKEVLQRIQRGEIRLVLGARSALFLPIRHLGLIIVDEEHDDAYKAQSSPRYNARDLAIYLGKKRQIQILLGSATPSPNSYYLAQASDSIFRLKKFFPSHNDLIFLRQKSELTPEILHLIRSTLQEKKQILVFLPTRANFKYLICLSCGENVKCPFCSISMSLHRNKNMMLCHYCGFSQKIPSVCHLCQSPNFYSHRIGTAQIAQELQSHFSCARIAIFDRDHVNTHQKLEKTLKSFAKQEIDILVGTQMLSKGHDYHNIGLAVVMGLDEILYFGDFRSREKAMSLFFQIKGRVGRRENGKVVIQTLNPNFFDCQDYEAFLQDELDLRKELYPPFKRLTTLTFLNKDSQKAQDKMQEALIKLSQNPHIQVVGGGKAKLEKINSKYRFMILLRSTHPKYLLQAIHHSKLSDCEIDIDPLNIV